MFGLTRISSFVHLLFGLKPESRFYPSTQVTFSKYLKITDLCIRNSDLNVCNTFLNSFRGCGHVFWWWNASYRPYFTDEIIGKTSKSWILIRISSKSRCYWCLWSDIFFVRLKIHKLTSEMERSRPVDSSRGQTLCLTPSEQNVINKIQKHFFLT